VEQAIASSGGHADFGVTPCTGAVCGTAKTLPPRAVLATLVTCRILFA